MNDTSHHPQYDDTPARVPLARLATQSARSPVLTRVVPAEGGEGPARVAVAAFQSSV